MTGIGKLLLITNIVLSVAFMSLAMAVFSTHTNWREEAQEAKTQVASLQSDVAASAEEVRVAQADRDAKVQAAEDQTRELRGRLQGVEAERNAFEAKNNRLEQELLTQTGLAEAKAAEAQFRREQAAEQSAVNLKLRNQVDTINTRLRDLQDTLFSKNLEMEQVTERYEGLLAETAELKTILANNNLSTDIEELQAAQEPPPPVDGLVVETRKDRTGNVRYVALSIGSDDGLRKGHQLSVVRPASRNQGRADYLGEIQIVSVENDTAVGLVIQRAKNGIIEVQDNVTSRL